MSGKHGVFIIVILMAFAGAGAIAANDVECVLHSSGAWEMQPGDEISFWAVYTAPTHFPGKVKLYVKWANHPALMPQSQKYIALSYPGWTSETQEFVSPELGQSKTINFTKKFKIPPNLPDGTKLTFVLMRIGVGDCGQPISTMIRRSMIDIDKSTNNDKMKMPYPGFLKMEGIDLTAEISSDDPIVVVKNQGTEPSGECELEFTISRDNVQSKWQKLIPALNPGQTTSVNFSDLVASIVSEYKVRACVDSRQEVAEYNENNNCAHKSYRKK